MILRRLTIIITFLTAWVWSHGQQINAVPDYVFRNQMSVGRNAVTDTAAYFSIGPRYGANKGFMPPIVGDTATFSSGKRNGLLIFSVQKNKFLYWDSVRVQWSDMAGSSGTYITGTGITGYIPQFNGTTTIDTSALFTLGSRLGIGTSSFSYTSASSSIELNGTAGGILGFKRNDSARGYLWHTGDNMELANTVAGAISFNTNSATRGSISSAGVWRLHNLAGTGDRVVVASSNGTLSASTSVTGLVDTTTISTRAWRQKGDDSLGAIIATKGSGTVTSVATGYGLSGGTITTTGTLLVDTLNIATRAWRQKGLDSLAALEVSGSGTTNYIPKFTASSTIGNSQIFDNGTNVGIGTTSPNDRLTIQSGTSVASAITFRANNVTSTSELFLGQAAGNEAYVYNRANQPMIFGTNNTERLRITSGGVVGINTQSPVELLSLAGSVGTTFGYSMNPSGWNGAKHRYTVPSAGDESIISYNYNGSAVDFASYATSSIGVGNGVLRFSTGGTNAAPSERMRIFANGRVGVNTTTDAGYQFDINGTLRSVNGANFATNGTSHIGMGTVPSAWSWPNGVTQFRFGGHIAVADNSFLQLGTNSFYDGSNYVRVNAGYSSRYLQNDGGHFWSTAITSTAGSTVTFNEQMRMTRDGELLINTTSDAGDYKLQVAGNIYASGLAKINDLIINGNSPFVTGANVYTNGQSTPNVVASTPQENG